MNETTKHSPVARHRKHDLQLMSLTKNYGDTLIVDAIDLQIQEGEFFAILGPSGCGKTTTLRMIAGLEEPSSGKIFLGGQDITDLPPYKRYVNTVFQNYALFPHMTIGQNVAFGLERRGIKKVKEPVEQMLDKVQLGHTINRKPAELSGGQQQRVAIARALINHPGVLLLDEPLGALDLKLRREMQNELKRIQLEVGITFVHVTHDQEEALTLADRVAVMNHGRIEQLSDPHTLYENPHTIFVANFLGKTNLIPGHYSHNKIYFHQRSGMLPKEKLHANTHDIYIGVRPEKIRIHHDPTQLDTDFVFPGTIKIKNFHGVATEYVIFIPIINRDITVFAQNDGVMEFATDMEVHLGFNACNTFVFDRHETDSYHKSLVLEDEEYLLAHHDHTHDNVNDANDVNDAVDEKLIVTPEAASHE